MFSMQYGAGCHKSPKGRCAKYEGVDVDGCGLNHLSGRCASEKGMLKRMGPKRQATPAQLDALARGRATRAANLAAKKKMVGGGWSQYGAGCHKSPKGRCAKYEGADIDGCGLNHLSGRCASEKGMLKRMGPKRQATPAQLDALARGRATRAANLAAKKKMVGGYYY